MNKTNRVIQPEVITDGCILDYRYECVEPGDTSMGVSGTRYDRTAYSHDGMNAPKDFPQWKDGAAAISGMTEDSPANAYSYSNPGDIRGNLPSGTAEIWLKIDNPAMAGNVFSALTFGYYLRIGCMFDGGSYAFRVLSATWNGISWNFTYSAGIPRDDAWHHMVIVWDESWGDVPGTTTQLGKFYCDGSYIDDIAISQNTNNVQWHTNAYYTGGGGGPYAANASVVTDTLRIYDVALSEEQITSNYLATKAGR